MIDRVRAREAARVLDSLPVVAGAALPLLLGIAIGRQINGWR